jgi:hypothetical protein
MLLYSFDLGIINQHKRLHINMYYPICFNRSDFAPRPISSKTRICNYGAIWFIAYGATLRRTSRAAGVAAESATAP